jgi:nucleoside-diphosphate-sugar epimerase
MILVTGGAGLLGQALITQLLENGERVVAVYHKTPLKDFKSPNLIQKQADILDVVALETAMEGVQKIYHCAALVSFDPRDREQLFRVNVEGTANIVNIALTNAVQKLIHVSSVAALGRIRENTLVDETRNWTRETSNSIYGESKFKGEMEVWRGIAEGLPAAIVNPSIILGAANWNSGSTAIFKNVYNKFPWYTTGTSGWVDVNDVVNAMIGLMESDITEQRFILSGTSETYQNVFNLIADGFQIKRPSKKVTPFLAGLIWRLEKIKSMVTRKKPLITKETVKTAMSKVYYDHSKILKALPGFNFTPLPETITRICNTLIKE